MTEDTIKLASFDGTDRLEFNKWKRKFFAVKGIKGFDEALTCLLLLSTNAAGNVINNDNHKKRKLA